MNYEKYINNLSLVSSRINDLLNDNTFALSENYLKSIHRYLFKDVYENNGIFRTHNLIRNEMTLNEDTVTYANYSSIESYLIYDLSEERKINYHHLSKLDQVKKIADFTARIWSTHPFGEGNTRTVAVFIQKYLKTLGYTTNNEIFKDNSRYFRNALVKASYYNPKYNIHLDKKPLITFFTKVMIDPTIELDEDAVYVNELFNPLEIDNRPDFNSPYIRSLLKEFIKARNLPKNISLNASGFMQYFLSWLDTIKENIEDYASFISYLDLNIKNYYLCEVGKGHYDSLLYNSNYRGIILSPYAKGFNHYNGNIIVDANLTIENNTPLIVPTDKNKKIHYPVDLGIKTFTTHNISSLSRISSWSLLSQKDHTILLGAFGNTSDYNIKEKTKVLNYFKDMYPDEFILESTTVDNTYCSILASKKLVRKK